MEGNRVGYRLNRVEAPGPNNYKVGHQHRFCVEYCTCEEALSTLGCPVMPWPLSCFPGGVGSLHVVCDVKNVLCGLVNYKDHGEHLEARIM